MKQHFLLIGLFIYTLQLSAQDPTFSQFFNSRTYMNPAAVAMDGGLTVNGTYRNQWNQIPGKFESQFLSVEALSCLGSAFGVHILHDSEGEGLLNTLSAGLDYAYLIGGEGQLRLGFGAAWYQKWVNWDALIFSDQLDAKDGAVLPSQADRLYDVKPSGLGFKAGFVYTKPPETKNGTSFSFGAGVTHLGNIRLNERTREGFYDANPIALRFSVFGEVVLPFFRFTGPGYLITVIPQFKYEQQSTLKTTSVGVTGHYNSFSLGVFYQNNLPWGDLNNTDAMSLYFGFLQTPNKNMLIEYGISYDTNNVPEFGRSNLGGQTGGVIELSVKLHFKGASIFCNAKKPRMNKNGKVNCPSPKGRHVNEWYKNQKRKNLN